MYDNLVRVDTYARMRGVTPECVRQWAISDKVKTVKIDGIRFVKLTKEEVKERKEL